MLPSAAIHVANQFHASEENPDNPEADISEYELEAQISQIGGWWGFVVKRFLVSSNQPDSPAHAMADIKTALLQDTISYGVVSAVMLTIAQAEMSLEDSHEARVEWRFMKQVHGICWYLCFAANMLCLYLSTTEYLYTVATHPKDIMLLLSKRYPPGFGKPPQCTLDSWLQYLKVGKLDAFKRGFQTMVPGLLSGVYLRCDWNMTIGPMVTSLLTCLLGWAMWKSEMRPKPVVLKPDMAARQQADTDAHLEPCRNSRELCLAPGPNYTPLPPDDGDAFNGAISALTDCAIGPPAVSSSGSMVETEGAPSSEKLQQHSHPSPDRRRHGKQRSGKSGQGHHARKEHAGRNGARLDDSGSRLSGSGSPKSSSPKSRSPDCSPERDRGARRIKPPPEPRFPKKRPDSSPSDRGRLHFDFD